MGYLCFCTYCWFVMQTQVFNQSFNATIPSHMHHLSVVEMDTIVRVGILSTSLAR